MNEFLVQVQPAYLPEQSAPAAGVYVFSYTITVTNTGEVPAQLIARHWIITNELGHVEEVKGLGVVGRQPLLQPPVWTLPRRICRPPTSTCATPWSPSMANALPQVRSPDSTGVSSLLQFWSAHLGWR